jgi:hypothetical protein
VSPLLHVDTCGEEIFRAIESGRSIVKFMPSVAGTLSGIWAFPRWLHDAILDDTTKLEVDFKGRQQVDGSGNITG